MEFRRTVKINSYLILASILIVFEILYLIKGHWTDDFFEHSAVVNELSKNLIHPNNPIIKSNIPHAFFSPYSILVAIFSKITGLNSIHSLTYFAFFNLIFFLYSFYYFCKNIFEKNYIVIASIALIFTMIFWGKAPFIWSGFFHILTLHYVLPYPSTFAMALVLLILAMLSKHNAFDNFLIYISIIISSAIVLITHPTTAITLYIGIIVLSFTFNNYSIKQCIKKSIILILPSLLLGVLWPYYNLLELFNETNSDFHSDSLKLYSNIFWKNWPLLFIIPGFVFLKKNSIIIFFVLVIVCLLLIYVGGYVFNIYGVSRVISTTVMFSHFLMAYYMVILISERKLVYKIYLSSLFVAIIISLGLNFRNLGSVVLGPFKQKNIEYYNKFSFLKELVKFDDVILSNNSSNWIIPSFQGKVVASEQPLYWIKDQNERRLAVNSFFSKTNPDSIRQTIINKYHPNYLLIDYEKVNFESSTLQWIKIIGQTIYKKNQIELLKIE